MQHSSQLLMWSNENEDLYTSLVCPIADIYLAIYNFLGFATLTELGDLYKLGISSLFNIINFSELCRPKYISSVFILNGYKPYFSSEVRECSDNQ
jgi:hypothetical protein